MLQEKHQLTYQFVASVADRRIAICPLGRCGRQRIRRLNARRQFQEICPRAFISSAA